MEKGNKFRVIYWDGNKEWIKNLVFKGKEGTLLKFFNEHNSKTEYINESSIIRMELDGDKDDFAKAGNTQ